MVKHQKTCKGPKITMKIKKSCDENISEDKQ